MRGRLLAPIVILAACGDNFRDNQEPVIISGLEVTTPEDTAVTRAIVAMDPDDDPLTYAILPPAHGTVTLEGADITYIPTANYHGPDQIVVTVSDGTVEINGIVEITVAPANDLPVGVADVFAASEDTPSVVAKSALLANDTDIDGDTLTVSQVGNPMNGTVAITGNDVTFTPAANFTGTAGYDYTLSDGTATVLVAVSLAVGGANDPPVATDDAGVTSEDVAVDFTSATLLANDGEPEGQTLAITAAGNATSGTVSFSAGTATFTPAANFNGTASFEYTVSDGALTDTGVVTVTVSAVNDAPIAFDDADATDEDTPRVIGTAALIGNDVDVDGPSLIVTGASNASVGTVSFDNGTGDTTYTPPVNFVGSATFDYTVTDGALFDTGTVTIAINTVNDPPQATDDLVSTPEDTARVFTSAALTGNDIDVDSPALAVTDASNASIGTVVFESATGEVTFTPPPNFVGMATFDYVVSDGSLTDTGTVIITVAAVDDPPQAVDDAVATLEDTPCVMTSAALTANDLDVDSPSLVVGGAGNASVGTVSFDNGTGDTTYTPPANFSGTATFDYTVSDGTSTDTGTVTVTVGPVNDPPVAVDDGAAVQSDSSVVINNADLLSNDSDGDGPSPLSISVVQNAQHGSVVLGANTITFTPDTGFVGTASFDYLVFDGLATDVGAVSVSVTPVCGDGAIVAPEICDDDDTDSGDGCNSACQVEPGWSCVGEPSACSTTCGDGIIAGVEQCDDQNLSNSDACLDTCVKATCGDGFVHQGIEPCDDGNPSDSDGCTTQCLVGAVCDATEYTDGDRFAVDAATGHCYISFDDELTTFSAAEAACVGLGGYLVTITSAAEDTLVSSVHNPLQNPWIGASEDGNDTDAIFDWATDEVFAYTHFLLGQPDDDFLFGGLGDCLHLFNAAGEWNDTSCNFAGFVTGRICEVEGEPCGDSVVQPFNGEQCDDSNTTDGDGCSATCQTE